MWFLATPRSPPLCRVSLPTMVFVTVSVPSLPFLTHLLNRRGGANLEPSDFGFPRERTNHEGGPTILCSIPGASCSNTETWSTAARRWGHCSLPLRPSESCLPPSASYLTRLKEQLPFVNHDLVCVGQGCPKREDVLILEDF